MGSTHFRLVDHLHPRMRLDVLDVLDDLQQIRHEMQRFAAASVSQDAHAHDVDQGRCYGHDGTLWGEMRRGWEGTCEDAKAQQLGQRENEMDQQ